MCRSAQRFRHRWNLSLMGSRPTSRAVTGDESEAFSRSCSKALARAVGATPAACCLVRLTRGPWGDVAAGAASCCVVAGASCAGAAAANRRCRTKISSSSAACYPPYTWHRRWRHRSARRERHAPPQPVGTRHRVTLARVGNERARGAAAHHRRPGQDPGDCGARRRVEGGWRATNGRGPPTANFIPARSYGRGACVAAVGWGLRWQEPSHRHSAEAQLTGRRSWRLPGAATAGDGGMGCRATRRGAVW